MALIKTIVFCIFPQMVYICIIEILAGCNVEHLCTFGCRQELALVIEQFEGIPLAGIVGSGDDDATVGSCHADGQFSGRGGGIADVDDIEAHAHQGAAYHILDHLARNASVAAHDDLPAVSCFFLDECGIGGGELDNV